MTKHTYGNWTISKACPNTGNIKIKMNGHTLALIPSQEWGYEDVDISKTEIQANARLISAAPDLLEALEGLSKALERMIEKHDPDTIEAEWLIYSSAALQKAKGGLGKC